MTTHAQELDRYHAQTKKSKKAYDRADKILPLGVSSNFRTYEPYPIYIDHAKGSKMWDVDGREYTDFSMTFGALMSGTRTPSWSRPSRRRRARARSTACPTIARCGRPS